MNLPQEAIDRTEHLPESVRERVRGLYGRLLALPGSYWLADWGIAGFVGVGPHHGERSF